MDFSDNQINNEHHQDLIITLLTKKIVEPSPKKKRTSPKPTRRILCNAIEYLHFVGEAGVSNDINFVAEVFSKHVIPVISKYKRVYLFSDGGPKHFKISSTLNMVLEAANDLINTKIEYHFFVSYHGHGICDSAAAHAKAAINRHINRTLTTPINAKEICDIINTVKFHRGIPIHEPSTPVTEVKTFRGIRSYHKFVFDFGAIYAFAKSSDDSDFHVFVPSTKE